MYLRFWQVFNFVLILISKYQPHDLCRMHHTNPINYMRTVFPKLCTVFPISQSKPQNPAHSCHQNVTEQSLDFCQKCFQKHHSWTDCLSLRYQRLHLPNCLSKPANWESLQSQLKPHSRCLWQPEGSRQWGCAEWGEESQLRILVPILISQMMMYRMREDSCLFEGFLLITMI